MPNIDHKRELERKVSAKIAGEAIQMMPGSKEHIVKLRSIQPDERKKNLYFSERMKEEAKKEVGWKNDRKLIPAPDEHEQAIIDLCSVTDTLSKEIIEDVLSRGTVAEKLELLKIIQTGKRAMVKENNSVINTAITANAPKGKPAQQNVQINLDRRGIAVNGMRPASSEPRLVQSQVQTPSTIHPSPEPHGTASKSPSDRQEDEPQTES